jgi:hypothetical protein
MPDVQIIDTFTAFLSYWSQVKDKSLDDQVDDWATKYMSSWPDLMAKQLDDYSAQNLDWRQIAREKVFPHLAERLSAMQQAHQNLIELCVPIYSKIQQAFAFESNVLFVFYVGIGCGAGWATTFRSTPAVLFGLENIAESGWNESEAITGLVAHELGHLVHYFWRAQHGKSIDSGSWWQLYEEGFAQRCEIVILGSNPWHQANGGKDKDWLSWCQSHKRWLASKFLRTVDVGESVSPFFGSWLEIGGKSETGYYLGYEVVKELEKQFSLKEIALLENVEAYFKPVLKHMLQEQGG